MNFNSKQQIIVIVQMTFEAENKSAFSAFKNEVSSRVFSLRNENRNENGMNIVV